MVDISFEDADVNVGSIPATRPNLDGRSISDPSSSTSSGLARTQSATLPSQQVNGQPAQVIPAQPSRSSSPTPSFQSFPPSRQPSPQRSITPNPSNQPSPARSATPYPSRPPTPLDLLDESDNAVVQSHLPAHRSTPSRQIHSPIPPNPPDNDKDIHPAAHAESASSGAFPVDTTVASSGRLRSLKYRPSRREKSGTSSSTPTIPPSVPAKRRKNEKENDTSNKPSKKPRKNAPPPVDEAAPAWFTQSYSLFCSEGLGDEWLELLLVWASFEAGESYKELGRLSSKGRPDVIQMWISRGRSTSWRPSITDTKLYGKVFNTWWANLQPLWRISNNGTINLQLLDGDWDCLRKPGLNGLQSVIAALFYWGIVAQKSSTAHKVWLSAVSDCANVFRCL